MGWTRRLTSGAVLAGTLLLVGAAPAAAHGIGGRQDLPVPLSYFVLGAGIAIVVSFLVLATSWREPRLQEGPHATTFDSRWAASLYRSLAWIGAGGFLLVLLGGLIDGSASRNNIAPVLVWVYFWLVIPFASAVVGDLWHWASPWRRIAAWAMRDRPERPDLLSRFGYWPAAVAFVAFTWLELVAPDSALPRTLAIAAIAYTGWVMAATYTAGPRSGLEMSEAFAVYNRFFGAIAPVAAEETAQDRVGTALATRPTRTLVRRRGWLRALPVLPVRPGMGAFVVAMIGTVTYDGMSSTSWWRDLVGDVWRETWFGTVALVGTVAVIGLAYYLASSAAASTAGSGRTPAEVAGSFAHTLVPIGFAYAFAHYFTLIVFEGQQILRMASDPFGLGWDLFGTADWAIVFSSGTTWIWYVQVAAIVAGHIGGVALAHDRALADFGERVAVRTQYAMLALMVALTSLGLFILSG